MRRRFYAGGLIPLLLVLAACAGLLRRPEPPRFTLADVTLVSASLLEQEYRVRLRLQNPNAYPLPIEGVVYDLRLNDRPFATGVSRTPVTVPAYGTEILDLRAFSGLWEVMGQLGELARRGERMSYRVRGHVRLKSPAVELPFDERGEFSFLPREPARSI